MVWNVYRYNINSRKIEVYNIFDHYNFNKDVVADLEKYRSREDFAKALKSHLMYYFWSKCEWEVLVSSWTDFTSGGEIKIDVYDQIMNNWDVFLDYVWCH